MTSIESYREQLRARADWDAFLQAESRLPGPRGNLELAHAAAYEGQAAQLERWAALDPQVAPENTPGVFLVFCGALGLGRLLAAGRPDALATLRSLASDPRWRVREGVATGLQLWGDADSGALFDAMAGWGAGSCFERRAAVAAVCEPRLLREPRRALQALDLLDAITASVEGESERRGEGFRALRKALGYGWSVAVAALPDPGQARLGRWARSADADVRWIVRENLGKARLARLDAAWLAALRALLEDHR